MSVAPLPSAPSSTGHPFAGVDVAAAAGLEVRPGAPRPVFDQEVWDLSGLVGAPVTMGAHRKILDFTRIVNHRWRTVAREYLLARIAPRHPAVATLPGAFRAPFNPTSLWGELNHLARWFDHLHHAGLVSLAEVGQEHCDTYLEEVSWTTTGTRRRMRPVVVAAFVRSAQVLTLYADILSDTYTPGFRPWGARGADDVAGYVRTKVNLVLPVPDALLRPLLADTLYLVDTIGPHLAPEAGRARTADQREVASRRYLAVEELPLLAEAIETLRAAGVPAPCLAAGTVTKRLAAGWEPDDPLLGVAWHSVVVAAVGAMGQRRDLERLRPSLQRWVAECGTEQRWCRNAALVGRLDTEDLVPWSLPTDRDHLASMISTVTSAALYVTSVLSGMRSSELHELTIGAARREERPGAAVRYRVVSRRIKGEAFGGVEDSWVVLEDVYRALRVAEAITGAQPGGLLFAKESNVAHARYTRMRAWINGPAGQRLGLMAIPDGPVNPRALRRTLVLSIAQRPHGLMAAKVHLKHVSVATTEGYAARPGGHQAAFLAEVSAAEQAEHERLTVAAYHDYRRGGLPSGKGARDLLACFEAVDRALADHDAGPVTVIDDRRVERLLRAKAETLHVGVANYCWFSDPRKALCLKLAGTPDAAEPMIGMCDSARCPQATHHPQHRQAWADHANATKVTFLDNPRLSKPERARAQAVFDRATAVVAEIDQANTPDSDSHGR
jgi:hypothetical protein